VRKSKKRGVHASCLHGFTCGGGAHRIYVGGGVSPKALIWNQIEPAPTQHMMWRCVEVTRSTVVFYGGMKWRMVANLMDCNGVADGEGVALVYCGHM